MGATSTPRCSSRCFLIRTGWRSSTGPSCWRGGFPHPATPTRSSRTARAMRTARLALGDTLTVRLRLGRRAVAGHPSPAHRRRQARHVPRRRPEASSARRPGRFYRAHGGPRIADAALRNSLKVRLWHGTADAPAFERGAERLAHGHDFQFTPFDVGARTMQSGLHLQAQALLGRSDPRRSRAVAVDRTRGGAMLEREARNDPALLALGMTLGELRRLASGPHAAHRRHGRRGGAARRGRAVATGPVRPGPGPRADPVSRSILGAHRRGRDRPRRARCSPVSSRRCGRAAPDRTRRGRWRRRPTHRGRRSLRFERGCRPRSSPERGWRSRGDAPRHAGSRTRGTSSVDARRSA